MPNLNVAVIAQSGYAKELGKKGTSSDITIYDFKKDQNTISYIEPSKYPERISSLFYACSLADYALISLNDIDYHFGECAIMLNSLNIRNGVIILKSHLSRDKINCLVENTVLEKYDFLNENFADLREYFLKAASSKINTIASEIGSVSIDHFFNIKGVGVVALGNVVQGIIRKNDTLKVLPKGQHVQIRSIQKHDIDYQIAYKGDRVGIALKGIDTNDLERGCVLSNENSLNCNCKIKGRVNISKYYRFPLKENMVVHIGHWMQFIPARILSIKYDREEKNPQVEFLLEKNLVYPNGSLGLICYLDGEKLRIVGNIEL